MTPLDFIYLHLEAITLICLPAIVAFWGITVMRRTADHK